MLTLDTTRILFMASPDFALPTLQALHTTYGIAGIMTRPDAPKGRGQSLEATPIKHWAIQHNIPVTEPTSKSELETQVHDLNPTLIIVIAYGLILPKSVTDKYICLNGHGSILPQYRGASPIHSSLFNNDRETGITIIKMNEKMDEGDILHIKKTSIAIEDNLQTLHDRLSRLCAEAFCEILKQKTTSLKPQEHSQASYCKKLHSEDRELLPTDSMQTKFGKIRAFSPKPGAFIIHNGKHIKILEAKEINHVLIPIKIQPEGKKVMTYHDYLLGNPEGFSLC